MRLSLLLVLGPLSLMLPLLQAKEESLRGDDRVGVVTDRQGLALVRPVGRDRWTPLGARSLLFAGDLVRTPLRGANAVELRLPGGGGLVLGPGALVEMVGPNKARLHRGDLEATGPVELTGPGGYEASVKQTIVVRGRDGKTGRLEQAPRWLKGYRASTTDEWMGSLVATVDGRDVPLFVGYHKVSVDIRDQIARTTVEESFVNSTKRRLEGIFYFPLPADASISGFGMWIGGELVEADMVEKQRARAIYEDILRRRKDPGLLEWSGGNLFKARVFPIEPHSEKRIRIRYTQVLALQGSSLRYRYALRSKMLRRHPLSELRVNVNISSSMPIRALSSPTHEIRARHSAHAASAEFSASEYSPQRDFELAVELDRGLPLSVIAHRRGPDGTFMLLLSPPGASGGKWERELLPEQDPIDLLLIADTSGSMDEPARAAQAAFVQGLLNLLGRKDRFRLMACDVNATWFREQALTVDEEQVGQALDFLRRRRSLGWTDLDKAFAAAAAAIGQETIVVYVGDGIGTTGDADPVALAQRLRRASKGTFHAVSTSSRFEKGVLEAIASIGGGSLRSTGTNPAQAAYRLLAEIAQPAVKNLGLRFEGLRTARVYPKTLPNLAAGTQQVVLGRFLPVEGNQRGRVTITGTLAGKPVRYSANLVLKQDEAGNSFLPRLWARRHIDALLAQGNSKEIQSEIVAFSEEMGIMTPYTSLLVLESDADRARYGVARRVKMRDGERFFAQGHDRAATQLLQQQMRLARSWRLRLRAQALREIATLGKHLQHAAIGWDEDSEVPLFAGQAEEVRSRPENIYLRGDAGVDLEFVEEESVRKAKDLADHNETDDDEAFDDEPAGPTTPGLREPEDFESPPPPGRGFTAGRRLTTSEATDFRPPNIDGRISFSEFGFPYLRKAAVPEQKKPLPQWPAAVVSLLRKLDRRAALAALPGGIELRQSGGGVHALHGHRLTRRSAHGLYGATGWFVRQTNRAVQEPDDEWLVKGERGELAVGLRLGRRRKATPEDRNGWNFPLQDFSLTDLLGTYSAYSIEGPVSRERGIVTLVLKAPAGQPTHVVLTIETVRGVLIEWTSFYKDKVTSTLRFADFVQVAGLWWAQKITQLDRKQRTVARYDLTIRSLEAKQFQEALRKSVADHGDVIFVGANDPKLGVSKQAVHEGRAGFAQHFRIALHFARSQQWRRVWQNFEAAAALVKDKPGVAWLRAALMQRSRRGAELKKELLARARQVAASDGPATDFLAEHVLYLAGGTHQPRELLQLLEALRPAFFRRGEDASERLRRYRLQRAAGLAGAGEVGQALELRKSQAVARPFDGEALLAYAEALRTGSERERAGRLLRRALSERKWLDDEANQLYDLWTQLLWEQRSLDELLEVCGAWTRQVPRNESGYQRRLATLLFLGRDKEADGWVLKQFASGFDPENQAPLGAAISFALGEGWNYWTGRVEQKWHKPLVELARRLMRCPPSPNEAWRMAQRIVQHYRFGKTDAQAELRKQARADLLAEGAIEAMDLPRLSFYLNWLPWGRNQVEQAVWRNVTDRVEARWKSEQVPQRRETLATLTLGLLDAHGEQQEAIGFLRERIRTAAKWTRQQVASQLGARLATQEWSRAIENEILALVPLTVHPEATAEGRRATLAQTVRRASDTLFTMRTKALAGPAAEQEKLARRALRRKRRKDRAAARAGLAARFAIARDQADAEARPWFELERLGFAAQLQKDPKAVDAKTRELLSSSKDWLLRERCAYLLEYLATRKKAPAELAEPLLALLADLDRAESNETSWKDHRFRLLMALDRPGRLAKLLSSWVTPASVESRWRIALGYLLAEQGKLKRAIESFESVLASDELRPAEYTALAPWYLASGDEKQYEQALLARYGVMREYRIARRIDRELARLDRSGEGVPADLDPDVLRAMRALLAKTNEPVGYLFRIRNLYRIEKDFRLLECLPYGVLGHTAQGIYPFLERLGNVVREVHEEATCDQLAARLHEIAAQAASASDRRGLLLLSAIVERRASEVIDAPGPHIQKGLAALRAALPGSWSRGERPLMASLLASLGKISDPAFAQEQLRQLDALVRMEKPGSLDRLQVAYALARAHWRYDHHDRAMDGLGAALQEYLAGEQTLPKQDRKAFGTLIDWLSARRHYGRAEGLILARLSLRHADWLVRRLFRVYVEALRNRGTVSLGSGEQLYRAARALMRKSMRQDPAALVRRVLDDFCTLHRAAQQGARLRLAGEELERFAARELDAVLKRDPVQAQEMISNVAVTLRDLRGNRAGLAFLIRRLEIEPAFYDRIDRGGWSRWGSFVAEWNHRARATGDLEPRLLKIVLRELKRDLLSTRARNRTIYRRGQRYFWQAKMDRFTNAVLRVIELNPDSRARQLYAARYLWDGLRFHKLAINTLLAAEQRGRLGEQGRLTLVQWLHKRNRFADSLPLLDKLLARHPERSDYAVLKIRALYRLKQDPAASALLDATEKLARESHRMDEGNIAGLGAISLECRFFARAVRFYEEVIALHQRTHRRRGVGQGRLSRYYGRLAQAHAGLGQSEQAIDAASAAVVSWGRTHRNRAQAIRALQQVIEAIPDLDAYVARREAQVRKSGLDAPLIRKTIGRIYLARKQAQKAIPQLSAARDLQPEDEQIHAALLSAYDLLGAKDQACEALMATIRAAPMKLALYVQLGQRFDERGDAKSAERARTTLVEVRPNEAESHRMLATIREAQKRDREAVEQWRQVIRIRTDEPPGWLSLARAQIRAGDAPSARDTLAHLIGTKWEKRFGDVHAQARRTLQSIQE